MEKWKKRKRKKETKRNTHQTHTTQHKIIKDKKTKTMTEKRSNIPDCTDEEECLIQISQASEEKEEEKRANYKYLPKPGLPIPREYCSPYLNTFIWGESDLYVRLNKYDFMIRNEIGNVLKGLTKNE